MPARNYKAQSDLAIKIEIYMDKSAIWLVNRKHKISKCMAPISPRRACNPCGYTMKISSMFHRPLIYDVK